MIIKVDFEKYMRITIEEAKKSLQEGNKGYGALVVYGNKIIGQAHDTAVTNKDSSLHAELNVLRQAALNLGDSDLSGCVLFSTCEPCPMCASLAVWSNVSAIVYGASIEETAELGKTRIMITCKEVVEKSPIYIEVFEGILKDDCLDLYKDKV
ncbi:MAG: hypothetical protein A2V66_05740 [Ignavibacteria bacterium RBG_13_36_8]|nr:MAG: hypothetical protein A2V66_05740 [Ignavibacteria bacterium RBG_13_36_8]